MAAPSPRPSILVAVIWLAVLVAGCLPASVGATPSPASPSPSASATPPPAASPTPSPATPAPSDAFVVHTVAPGDSLAAIGRRYETTGRSIAYWNRATYPSLDPEGASYDPDRLQIGWSLTVYPGREYDPETDDAPTPSPTPQGSLAIPPAPTPGTSGGGVAVSNGGRGGNAIALTLDMGGRMDPAVDIVTWLIEHEVHATIFPTGKVLSETPEGRAVGALLAAHPELFTVGNHSWDHPDFTTLGATEMRDQLERTDAAIRSVIGVSSAPLFRPPYGAQDAKVRAGVAAAGWPYVVMWDIDTIDWRPVSDGGPTAEDIRAKVLARAEGGSIVLMHLGGWNTLEALPGIVDGLRARGLTPVTLHRLLGLEPGG